MKWAFRLGTASARGNFRVGEFGGEAKIEVGLGIDFLALFDV